MRSISVTWTATVELAEAHFALDAIHKIIGQLHHTAFRLGWFGAPPDVNVFGDWYIPNLPEEAPYRSLQWYVDQSYDWAENGIQGPNYLKLLADEPWQRDNPHYDLSIVGQPFVHTALGPKDADPLAMSIPGVATAISLAPLRQIKNDRMRLFAVRRITAHQLGHLLGIPSPDSSHHIEAGAGERHCINVCAMRHAADMDHLTEMALRELSDDVLLCEDCRDDLKRMMLDQYFVIN